MIMTPDDDIFSSRPETNRIARPEQQELSDFLDRTMKDGVAEPHAADLARYRRPLYHVENFEGRSGAMESRPSAGEQAFLGALLHSRFFNRALLTAVGQYKFHLHELAAIDIESPRQFIESAGATMKKLSRRKINDVLRMGRLREMVRERQKMLEQHRSRWAVLTAELLDIALYALENLVRIERLCGRSLAVLEPGRAAKKEEQLVGSIRQVLKEQLKDALNFRTVTTDDVARAKQEADRYARELHDAAEEDRSRMAVVFGAVREHVRRCAEELDDLLEEFRGTEIGMDPAQVVRFRRIELALVLTVSGYPEQIDPVAARTPVAGSFLVEDKRQELVAFLLDQVQKGPARIERRAKQDRRKGKDLNYNGPERRSGRERRR